MRTNKLKMRETMIAYAFLAPISLIFLNFCFCTDGYGLCH